MVFYRLTQVRPYLRGIILLKRQQSAFNFCARTFTVSSTLNGRLYTKRHEWVNITDDLGTVGISHYAQESLGDIVYVELPEIGSKVNTAEPCGALESVKAASELFSPITGVVVDRNVDLESAPELVNKSCYDEGWLFRVEVTDNEGVKDLMTEEQYKEFLKIEGGSSEQ